MDRTTLGRLTINEPATA